MSRREEPRVTAPHIVQFPWLIPALVGATVLLIMLTAAIYPSDFADGWRYYRAGQCPEESPRTTCLADLEGATTNRITTRSAGGSSLQAAVSVDVPEDSVATEGFDGDLVVRMSNSDADRLGLTGSGQDVTVRLFDNEAVRITGPNSESATLDEPSSPLRLALFAAVVVLALISALVLAVLLLRHRGPERRSDFTSKTEADSAPEPYPDGSYAEAEKSPGSETALGESDQRVLRARVRSKREHLD